jgi:hypothetical protein
MMKMKMNGALDAMDKFAVADEKLRLTVVVVGYTVSDGLTALRYNCITALP